MDKKINLKDIKYVFFDMDGTFLNSKKEPLASSLNLLEKLRELKIKYSFATGRPYFFAQREIDIIKPTLPIISCNGSLIYDSEENKLLSSNCIDNDIAKKIFDILIENNAVFLVYTKDRMFTYKNEKTNPESKWINWVYSNNLKSNQNQRATILPIDNLENFKIKEFDVIKFLVIESEIDKSNLEIILKKLNLIKDVYIVRSQNGVFDIMPSKITKGFGLKILDEKNIINLKQTIVFGDAENDISMFEKAKWSVAMGNAQDIAKSKAIFITDNNDNDGIYKFFDKLLNNEN